MSTESKVEGSDFSLAQILQLALVEPEPTAPVEPEQVDLSADELSRPEFIKPQLPEVKKQPIEEMSGQNVAKKLVRFGVILESFDERILSEVTRDALSLISSLPPGKRLVVCSPNSGPFWERLAAQLPLDFQFGGFESVPVWKVYWINVKPEPPEGVMPQFFKRVANPTIKRVLLRRGLDTTPTPVNPDANRMLPMQMDPAFRRVPTLAPVTMTPQLYMWSSRSPNAGEKVLFPGSEEVLTIATITGSMAKVGPNHVQLDMSGFEYYGNLDIWASRSYKKEPDGKD